MSSEMVSKCCGVKAIVVSDVDRGDLETGCTNYFECSKEDGGCGKPCEVVPKEEQPQMVRCPIWDKCEPRKRSGCPHAVEHILGKANFKDVGMIDLPSSCKGGGTTLDGLTCPACVPVEPADEALQKQHEQWLKDQEFYQQDVDTGHPYDQSDLDDSKPVVKPENPRLLTDEEWLKNFTGDSTRKNRESILIAQDKKSFEAGRASIPSKEEIAKAFCSVICHAKPCHSVETDELRLCRHADDLIKAIHNLMGGK